MNQKTKKLFRFGGIAFIIAGILFFARYLFVFSIPNMPASDVDFLKWLDDWKFNIAMSNEFFFFATISLVPAIFVLFKILNESDNIKAILGCGIFAVVIPVFACLDIIQGRLVYPVYNIVLSANIQKLVLSIYHGGMHATFIMIGIATIILSFGIKNTSIGKPIMYLGFITGVFDFLNAYPWVFGSIIVFISELLFALWFVFIGVKIIIVNKAN
ncbi:MAG: hypothetical protein IPP15_00870 [Saprospiraceae bacterium]|uniref:DUF4386 domain-containing protein n=1 Tax=Candidatus Opimibacter skivensis TaxID=2982028 RepID=A0A9D7SRJ2_9BACT|nr:hypothetical protein [Candidatus Opimibacter skivensis]